MKKFLRGLFIVLLVLVLLYAAYYFFLKEPEKEPFEVLYEEEKVSNLAGLSISPAEPLVLQVNYGLEDIQVSVMPCKDAALTYTVDGVEQSFDSILDATAAFTYEVVDGEFILTPKGGIETTLSALYEGKDVEVVDIPDEDLFTLILSSEDQEYRISFAFYVYDVDGITLPGKLVF